MGESTLRTTEPTAGSPQVTGYLSGHLANTRTGGGYSRSRYAQQAWNTFGQFLPMDLDCRILAIGPGGCEFEELLQVERGYRCVEVVDVDAEVLEVARKRKLTAHLTEDLADFLINRPATFDVVVMLHVLEHIQKAHTIPTLEAIRTALVPASGVLLLEVPNMGDPFNGVFMRFDDFTHEVGFTEHSLTYVLGQARFDSIQFTQDRGAANPLVRLAQRLARAIVKTMLMAVSLPNGRQMNRRIGPTLSVCAK